MEIGKKIIVMGGSCAGKSTMSQNLSEKFKLPVVYLDLHDPYAVPDGPERENRKQEINQVIQNTIAGDSWVIDGTYVWYAFKERFDNADTLILLVSPVYRRLWCYIKTCALKIKRHGRQGFSAKNFRWDHVWYMLRKHDAPYKEIGEAIQKHPDLQVVKLKSYKEATKFLKSVRLKTK